MSLNTIKRLQDELSDINNNPNTNISLTAGKVDNNIFEWQCTIQGPKDTPYEGGLFYLRILFPNDYPIKGPEVCFKTPIYHLNVNPRKCSNDIKPESLGHICMSTLNDWKSTYTIKQILEQIFSLFHIPNPESPYGLDRTEEFLNERELYEEKAKIFTKKYADPNNTNNFEFEDQWDFSY